MPCVGHVSFELEAHQVHVKCFDDAPNHGAQNSKRRYSRSDPSKRCFSSKIWQKPRLVIFSQNKGKRRIPSWERPTSSQAQNLPPGLKIFWSTAGSRSWIITDKNHLKKKRKVPTLSLQTKMSQMFSKTRNKEKKTCDMLVCKRFMHVSKGVYTVTKELRQVSTVGRW